MKKSGIVLGLILAALGVAFLNDTVAFNHEHHMEWSAERGLPAPSGPIFFAGAGLCVLGGVLLGSSWGRR
jgi:hypothetical protein